MPNANAYYNISNCYIIDLTGFPIFSCLAKKTLMKQSSFTRTPRKYSNEKRGLYWYPIEIFND